MVTVKIFLVLSFVLSIVVLAQTPTPLKAQTVVAGGRVVLDQGNGAWEKYVWRPSVIQLNPLNYAMYYSGENDQGVSNIGVAFSSDGLAWARYSGNPVLTTSPGAWDSGSVQEGWVMFENGNFKMWYTGESLDNTGNPIFVAIGYATSPDGTHWQKWQGNPVLRQGATGSWDDQWVFRPTVIPTAPGYTMYYQGRSAANGQIRIGAAYSSNGTDWVKVGQPISVPQGIGGWNPYYLGSTYKIVEQTVLFTYGSPDSSQPAEIGYAKSANGIDWDTTNPIIMSGPSGSWDDDGVILPSMVAVGNDYYIYYTGFQKASGSRIGLSMLSASNYPIPEFPDSIPTVAGIFLISIGVLQTFRKKRP